MKPTFNKFNKYNNEQKTGKKKKSQNSESINKTNAKTVPIGEENRETSQIISGYFLNEKSYKELVIARLNNFLYGVLGFLVLTCFVSYYFVSCSEVELNQISRSTLELNYENEELQNKVDSLQSYYNIDKAVAKANILERAKQVVEVDAIDLPSVNFADKSKKSKKDKDSIVVSF